MQCSTDEVPVVPLPGSHDVLTDVLRAGAQKPLSQAVEAEVHDWIRQRRLQRGVSGLAGSDVKGLSATTVTHLKGIWQEEYQHWRRRDLEGKRYVYVWADGIHFNIRLEDERQCILVLIGGRAGRHQGSDRHQRGLGRSGASK